MVCDILPYTEVEPFPREYYLAQPSGRIARHPREPAAHDLRLVAEYLQRVMGDAKVPVLKTTTGIPELRTRRCRCRSPSSSPVRSATQRDPGVRYYFKNSTEAPAQGPRRQRPASSASRPTSLGRSMRNLWISGPGLTVGLHFDAAENFNFQLRGRKTLHALSARAFAPSTRCRCSRRPRTSAASFATGPRPTCTAFPRFDRSRGITIELRGRRRALPARVLVAPGRVATATRTSTSISGGCRRARKQLPNWNQALRGHIQLLLRYLKFGKHHQGSRCDQKGREKIAS